MTLGAVWLPPLAKGAAIRPCQREVLRDISSTISVRRLYARHLYAVCTLICVHQHISTISVQYSYEICTYIRRN